MKEIRNYIWIFPFIGSIIAVIGLFTPAAVYPAGFLTEIFWMYGFYLIVGGGVPDPGFYTNIPGLMIVGISSMIIIIVCTIILFVSSQAYPYLRHT